MRSKTAKTITSELAICSTAQPQTLYKTASKKLQRKLKQVKAIISKK